MRGLGETVERQMVESSKLLNMKDDELPSAERRQDIALLALMGFTKVKVFSKPSVCIISIGDELADESSVLKSGEVPCNHALMIGSFASRDGGVPLYFARVSDDPSLISEAVLRATSFSVLVLAIGGASRGEKDLVFTAISRIDGAKIVFHGMMMRLGRQTRFAIVYGKTPSHIAGLGAINHNWLLVDS